MDELSQILDKENDNIKKLIMIDNYKEEIEKLNECKQELNSCKDSKNDFYILYDTDSALKSTSNYYIIIRKTDMKGFLDFERLHYSVYDFNQVFNNEQLKSLKPRLVWHFAVRDNYSQLIEGHSNYAFIATNKSYNIILDKFINYYDSQIKDYQKGIKRLEKEIK